MPANSPTSQMMVARAWGSVAESSQGLGRQRAVETGDLGEQQSQAARGRGGVGLGTAADGADGLLDEGLVGGPRKVFELAEDEALDAGRGVGEDEGQDLELELPDRRRVGSADEKVVGVLDKVLRAREADGHYVVEGNLLDILRAAQQGDEGPDGGLEVLGRANVGVASRRGDDDGRVAALQQRPDAVEQQHEVGVEHGHLV
ncbi:hypothetical protein VDGD_20541 [Verticillium dahliae]|nr:hypothetical protein VDGD_20541 [Verticillium dahliae]